MTVTVPSRLLPCTASPALFFGPDGEQIAARTTREAAAKALCAGCPARAACLGAALATGAEYGVWGGLGENELAAARRRPARRAPLVRASTRHAAVLERVAAGVKTCPHCEREKDLGEFGNARKRADGRTAWCLECIRGRQAEIRQMLAEDEVAA